MEDTQAPKVFISYSQDSPDHKRWVAELATRLRNDGIDITLDQWDLSLGDDVTKFMEDGLSTSDRVLLVCTDNYVRKADAGVGGVAYERMIVTAELVHNLGTQKFIPVVRQDAAAPVLPKFMGARFYVNLSKSEQQAEQYEALLRELHKVPAIQKPPIGKNPFATQPSGIETPIAVATFTPLSTVNAKGKSAEEVYASALEIARQGDLVGWRRLVKDIRSTLPSKLQDWRTERTLDEIREKKDLAPMMDEAIGLYAPLFGVALAGIQSGRDKFRDQRAVIDELTSPTGWVRNGNTAIVDIPYGMIFVFQALCGATFLDTDQLDLAVQLAQTRIPNWYESNPAALIDSPHLLGWPESLGGTCTVAWEFLFTAAQRWPWLATAFGVEADYRVALSAYYMALHIIELAATIKAGKPEELLSKDVRLFVPLSFLHNNDGIPQKAYRLLLRNNANLLWESAGVSLDDMKKYWPAWMKHSGAWLSNAYKFWFRSPIVHEHLLEEYNNR